MKVLFPIKKGVISQNFGENAEFYKERFGVSFHNGTDIVSYHGDTILCPEDGKIVRTFDIYTGSVTAGFGLYLLGEPDANGEANLHILWHTMSNLQCGVGYKVKQGDVLAYEGASGQVYVNMQPVPDDKKGVSPFPGTHLHWGKQRVIMTAPEFYTILNPDNGVRGCIDPMKSDIIYYGEWLLNKVAQETPPPPILPLEPEKEEVVSWLTAVTQWITNLIDKLKGRL